MSNQIAVKVPLFGDGRYGFIEMVKYYSDMKVGYDGVITRIGKLGYEIDATRGPTVGVRHPSNFKSVMANFQNIPNTEEYLDFQFSVPVRKGYQVKIDATLSSWDGSEPLANSTTIGHFDGITNMSDNLIDAKEGDEYGYVQVGLSKLNGIDPINKEDFLQEKIDRWLKQGLPVTNRLFLLRVSQLVWPVGKEIDNIRTDFGCRDDSVIVEMFD